MRVKQKKIDDDISQNENNLNCVFSDLNFPAESYLNNNNKHEALENFRKIIDLGVQFKFRNKIAESASFDELMKVFNETIPDAGMGMDQILSLLEEKVLPYSTNFSSPYAMAFPDAGNSIAAISGSLLSDLINQNLINWKPCAPVGTVIEVIVLNWLRKLVGFPYIENPQSPMDVGGMITTGGVSSNTISQLIAREKALPCAMKEGVIDHNMVSIVPEGIDHYSSRLAMGWLGLGEKNVIRAPTVNFRYDLKALAEIMENLHKKNKKIMSLIAYAGDSRSMTCDNFIELRKLCDRYNVWLHADGCHGTQLLFSKNLKHKLLGIEHADSITLDPHKVLNIPYVISVLLLKNTDDIKLIQRPEDIITGEKHSFGQVTPLFGSRAFFSLKLYMLIKNLGVSGLAKVIEKRHYMACLLADMISKRSNFCLINPEITINSVMFMYRPEGIRWNKESVNKLNLLNSTIQNELLSTGKIWLHNFNIPDLSNVFALGKELIVRPLRFMSGNPNIEISHLEVMLDEVERCGEHLSYILKDE